MCLNLGINELLRRLGKSTDSEVREQIIDDLVKIGGFAIELMDDALTHKNPNIRRGAEIALEKIKKEVKI